MINLFYDLFHRIIDEGSGAQLIAMHLLVEIKLNSNKIFIISDYEN
jgi:hypothetical protein